MIQCGQQLAEPIPLLLERFKGRTKCDKLSVKSSPAEDREKEIHEKWGNTFWRSTEMDEAQVEESGVSTRQNDRSLNVDSTEAMGEKLGPRKEPTGTSSPKTETRSPQSSMQC